MTKLIFYYPIGSEKRVVVHEEEVDYNPEIGATVFPHSMDLHAEYEIVYRIFAIKTEGKKRVAYADPAGSGINVYFLDGRREIEDLLYNIYAISMVKVLAELPPIAAGIGFNKAHDLIMEKKLFNKVNQRVKKELQKLWSRENDS